MVSVIIPFYSHLDWLEEALESVFDQTYKDYEIIVINDGSTEDLTNFKKKYLDRIVYFEIKNSGPAYARNVGIENAKGKYITFLDSDDLWLPTKLEKQVRFMEDHSVVWSHTLYAVFNNEDEERKLTIINNEDYSGNIFPLCFTSLKIGTPCVMILTQFLRTNSNIRFSENMRFGQDGYLWMLIGMTEPLGLCKEVLTYVRRSGGNAVQRARVHLYVKGKLYENLIKNMQLNYPGVKLNMLVKLAYAHCGFGNNIVSSLENSSSFNIRKSVLETVSKIIYLPTFIFFKLYSKKVKLWN